MTWTFSDFFFFLCFIFQNEPIKDAEKARENRTHVNCNGECFWNFTRRKKKKITGEKSLKILEASGTKWGVGGGGTTSNNGALSVAILMMLTITLPGWCFRHLRFTIFFFKIILFVVDVYFWMNFFFFIFFTRR